jgi:hypothetical protein
MLMLMRRPCDLPPSLSSRFISGPGKLSPLRSGNSSSKVAANGAINLGSRNADAGFSGAAGLPGRCAELATAFVKDLVLPAHP